MPKQKHLSTLLLALLSVFLLFTSVMSAGLLTNGDNASTNGSLTIESLSADLSNIAPDITIRTNGQYYEAIQNSKVIFGGLYDAGGVNGSSFSDIIMAASKKLSYTFSGIHCIEIQSGHYLSDKSATLESNIIVYGHGDETFIQQKALVAPSQCVFVIPASVMNVAIMNLWIDGNRDNQTRNGDTHNQGILAIGSHILIDNVRVTNMLQCGIDAPFANNLVIQNSRFSGSGDGEVWIDIGTKDFTIRNNIMSGGNIGIALAFFDDCGKHPGLITNNTVDNMTCYGISCWKGASIKPSGIIVSYNNVNNCQQSGVMVQGFTNSSIEYNIITNNRFDGITLSGSDNIVIKFNSINLNNNCGIKEMGTDHNTIAYNDLSYNAWTPLGYGNPALDGSTDLLFSNIQ